MNMRTLDAKKESNLDWEIDPDYEGIWFLDFGLDDFNPYDQMGLSSHFLALEEFLKQVPEAKKVCLARVDGRFSKCLRKTNQFEEEHKDSSLNIELYSAQIFSAYLQQLASILPDEVEPVVFVDLDPKLSYFDALILFCKRRFEHLTLHFAKDPLPIEGEQEKMISLPQDEYLSSEYMSIYQNETNCKYVPEELLNEHWVGVDELCVDQKTMGAIAKRMIEGFESTGGKVKAL